MSISFLRPRAGGLLAHRDGPKARRRALSLSIVMPESLEARLVMSAAATSLPAIQVLSATTTNSKSVTVDYQVNQPLDTSSPTQLGIYRSSNDQFDAASDSLVATVTLASPGGSAPAGQNVITVDQTGLAATSVGTHEVTIPLAQGLPPFPEKPYVLVVANPGSPTATTQPEQTASFRVYTIGIVTHGGIQDTSWKHGPPWELETAYLMKHEGFDSVIAYNWVNQSSTPGAAIKQSPRLARMILTAASKAPAGDPVDLELIGHSEGTVVNAYALVKLESEMTPQLASGYIDDTPILDPHAANNSIPGQQMSFAGALGGLARVIVTNYQSSAKDPAAFVPAIVDQAQVFFQHSQATSGEIYNLWGQVPVKSNGPLVHYYNLTDMGATHSGKTGVNYWYRDFIAPTLGYQSPLVQELQLNGQIADPVPATATSAIDQRRIQKESSEPMDGPYAAVNAVQTAQPEFTGTAAPGSIIRLGLSLASKPTEPSVAGVATANSNGQWSLTTSHPLRNGQYRVLITAFSRALRTRPGLTIVPTQPLGRLIVDAPSES